MISCLLLIVSIARGTQFLEVLTTRPQFEVKEETCQTPVTFLWIMLWLLRFLHSVQIPKMQAWECQLVSTEAQSGNQNSWVPAFTKHAEYRELVTLEGQPTCWAESSLEFAIFGACSALQCSDMASVRKKKPPLCCLAYSSSREC